MGKRKMSMKPLAELDQATKDQMAVVFATLLLHDTEQEVSEDSLNNVLSKAGVKVEPYWPGLFLGAIGGKDISEFLTVSGGGGSGGQAGGDAGGAQAEDKTDEPEEEEASVSMGGLFSD